VHVREENKEPEAGEKDPIGISLSSARGQIQHLLDAFPFYVILIDSRHNIVAVNRQLARDFSVSPQQLIGAYCPILIHGCNSPIPECPLVEASQRGESVEKELFDSVSRRWMLASVFPTPLVTDDGSPIYLHFARDITGHKNTEEKLSHSLEHHGALCDLLQKFQYCQTGAEILEALIEEIVSLSWLGMSATAVGFLAKNKRLEMVAKHNVPPAQIARCRSLNFGECLCGKVAESGQSIFRSSLSPEHEFKFEGIGEHRHAVLPISHEGQVLGVLTLYLQSGEEPSPFQVDFLNAASSAAAAALAGQFAREEVKRVREKSMAQVISYQEDERKRIARELHDQVCQSLSALLLEMQAHGSMDESLREIQKGCEMWVRGLIDEVSRMAGQLRPSILDDYGLEMALARHIEELSLKTGLSIDYQYVSFPGPPQRLPAPIEVGLYRVAIAALDNVIRHAQASGASVVILCQNSKLVLLVEDDGRGFDYPAVRKDLDGCLGLIGMEERTALMGGVFRIESTPQQGTMVRAEVPMPGSTH
jgi:PAS domain S-box-containing protein